MKLLISLKPEDINRNSPKFDYAAFKPRTAARAVVLDNKKIALIHVKTHGYYMLPGGGVDSDDLIDGLKREALEELGCEIEILGEIGKSEIYLDRWNSKQTDYCYLTKKINNVAEQSPTEFELNEGHSIVWAKDLDEAILLVKSSKPVHSDGKLVQARELVFLKSLLANN